MHNKQIVAAFFSIILLSGITGVFSPTTAHAEPNKVWRVYVEELPSWANIGNVLELSFAFWEQRDNIKFELVGKYDSPDFTIQWVKDFGQSKIGHALYSKWVEASLGDSNCNGQWNAFQPMYVRNLLIHEIGHAIGYDHETQGDSYMHPIIQDKRYGLITLQKTIPENWWQIVPLCVYSNSQKVFYSVDSSSNSGFNVYIVPSYGAVEKSKANKPFSVYSDGTCQAVNVNSFGGVCNVGLSSYLFINGVEESTTVTIKIQDRVDYIKNFKVYDRVTYEKPSSVTNPTPTYTPQQPNPNDFYSYFLLDPYKQQVTKGNEITLSGKFLYQMDGNIVGSFSGAKIHILENNTPYQPPNQDPIMGTAYTDDKGNFQLTWKARENPYKLTSSGSLWTPMFYYAGDDPLLSEASLIGPTITVSNPVFLKTETILSVAKQEYFIPDNGFKEIDIYGKISGANGKYNGQEVTVEVTGPNYYQSKRDVISNDSFSVTVHISEHTKPGSYSVKVSKGGYPYFESTGFSVVSYDKKKSDDSIISSPKSSNEESKFRAFGETSDGVSLSLSKHALDVSGTLSDRRVEIVVGVQDWKESETEPKVQIFGLYEKGRTSVQHPPLTRSQGADGITYFKGYVTAERGMHLATYEVQVNWAKYTDGTQVRMSPPVESYEVYDSNPEYYENQSYKNKAYDDKLKFQNKIELYSDGIKTAEQSLSSLQYDSPEAQKKIGEAWDVRWLAITKLETINSNFKKANASIENGKFKDAVLQFETIEKVSNNLEDDLKWISAAISDAKKFEEQHKSFGFFGSAFASQEGSNCIWFICW